MVVVKPSNAVRLRTREVARIMANVYKQRMVKNRKIRPEIEIILVFVH